MRESARCPFGDGLEMRFFWYLRNFRRGLRDVVRAGAGLRLGAVFVALGFLYLVAWVSGVGASSVLYALF